MQPFVRHGGSFRERQLGIECNVITISVTPCKATVLLLASVRVSSDIIPIPKTDSVRGSTGVPEAQECLLGSTAVRGVSAEPANLVPDPVPLPLSGGILNARPELVA